MALRAFHANPFIGGFGNESSSRRNAVSSSSSSTSTVEDGDAVCQIIKELVDNAVDACQSMPLQKKNHLQTTTPLRVKVELQPMTTMSGGRRTTTKNHLQDDDDRDSNSILKVTVCDNGCGMSDISKCVDAFQSTKSNSSNSNQHHAGRYGIGLTLSLLHAQRLVPHSVACITSTTRRSQRISRRLLKVNVAQDQVEFVQQTKDGSNLQESIPKPNATDSGTCVSLLVPGGAAAKAAWPRLLNYLERFRLAPDIRCSLEVVAPTFLTNYPIHIRTSRLKDDDDDESQSSSSLEEDKSSMTQRQREAQYTDGGLLHDPDSDDSDANIINAQPKQNSTVSTSSSNPQVERQRKLLTDAARAYLQRPVSFQNVAVSLQPIRLGNSNAPTTAAAAAAAAAAPTPRTNNKTSKQTNKNKKQQPTMKVALIASTPPLEDQEDDDDASFSPPPAAAATCSTAAGTVKVIRLVNDIPLLDSAEAAACGLVKSVAKKAVWGSYGLQVALRADDNDSSQNNNWVPTLDLEDSELAKPFLKTNHSPHALWNEHDGDDESSDSDSDHDGMGRRRGARREQQQRTLIPAKARIGELLVLVSITADPSSLPLPTLSKGRLPMNHAPIDNAFQVGLRECLRSLQKTNPDLLLTPSQLRDVERDVHYIPSIAIATSKMLQNFTNPSEKARLLTKIQGWSSSTYHDDDDDDDNVVVLSTAVKDETQRASLIERQLRKSMEKQTRIKNRQAKAKRRSKKTEQTDEEKSSPASIKYKSILSSSSSDSGIDSSPDRSVGIRRKRRPVVAKEEDDDDDSMMGTQEESSRGVPYSRIEKDLLSQSDNEELVFAGGTPGGRKQARSTYARPPESVSLTTSRHHHQAAVTPMSSTRENQFAFL